MAAVWLLQGCHGIVRSTHSVHQGVVVLKKDQCWQVEEAGLTWVSGAEDKGIAINHNRFWLVQLRMGVKPSGGYGLDLQSDQLTVLNQTASFTVLWNEPAPGTFLTQALTSPCLYLQIPKGSYQQLQVLDQAGNVRFKKPVP